MNPHWVSLLDVVFGAVLVLAFENLEKAFVEHHLSFEEFATQGWVACCLMAFFLYDVTAYHVLRGESPYGDSWWGMSRFFLDVLMAFLLAVILFAGLRVHPETRVRAILVAAMGWHVSAAIWHALAWKDTRGRSRLKEILMHSAFAAAYLAVAAIAAGVSGRALDDDWVLIPLVTAILGASLLRSAMIISAVRAERAT